MEKIKSLVYSLHRKYDFHKILTVILCLSNFTYLTYLLIIGYFNVIAVDDYCFMNTYHNHGLIGSIPHWYNTWQGRFSPQFLTNLIVKGYELFYTLLPYTILLIVLFVCSIVKILKLILPAPGVHLRNYQFLIINLSFFLFNLFLITNFDFSSFYWICASTIYFGGLAFGLLGTSQLLSQSKSFLSYALIGIGFTYAGSSAEHFGAICVMLLSLYFAYLIYFKNIPVKDIFKSTYTNKALFALAICLISFLIMVAAPGNEVRRSYFPRISIIDASAIGIKSLFDLVTKLMTEKVKYLLILSFPFVYLGTLLRKKETVDEFKVSLILAVSFPLFILFLYISVLPSAYAISSLGPLRGLTHIAFYLVCYVAFLSFLIGYKTLFPRKIALTLSFFCCLFFLLISRDRIRTNLPDTIQYTQSERARIDKLLTLKAQGNKEPVVVDSLYTSPNNVLWYNEIGKDSTDVNNSWINYCISEGLELGFEIKLKK